MPVRLLPRNTDHNAALLYCGLVKIETYLREHLVEVEPNGFGKLFNLISDFDCL